MPRTDFHVPAATQNPMTARVNAQHLPASRPTLEFPIYPQLVGDDRLHASIVLLSMAGACMTVAFMHSALFADPESHFGLYIVLFVIGYVVLGFLVRTTEPSLRAIFITLATIGCSFLIIAVFGHCPLLLYPIFLGASLFEAVRFRTHYVHRATAGMLDETTIQNFRRHFRIPAGLRPRSLLAGFVDAVVSYLTYNRQDIHLPGVFQSPAGCYVWRLAKTVFLLCGLSCAAMTTPRDALTAWLGISLPPPLGTVLGGPLGGITPWLAVMFFATVGIAGKAYALKTKQVAAAHWPRLLDRIARSPDKTERDSTWLGLVDCDRSPILVPFDNFLSNTWIVGKTGSGKTAYLMLLLDQFIQRADTSVVYIDLRAVSNEVLASMQHAAGRASRRSGLRMPLKHVTLDDGLATYLFNIFTQQWWLSLPAPQRTRVILSALELSYSRAFGKSWYTDSAYKLMHFVIRRHADIRSWADLRQRLLETIRHARPWEVSDQVKRDGEHVLLVVERLADLPALNDYGTHAAPVLKEAIDFANAFQSTRHYYFALGAVRNGLIAGEVARLVAASLLNAACAARYRPTRVLLVIDDFHEMVTGHLALLLTQARSLNVGVILANQTTSQLVTPDCDLRPIVEGNTSLQVWMQITDDEGREQLRRLGGQHVITLTTTHKSSEDTRHTYTEHLSDRVSGNLTSAVGSDPRRLLMRITDNAGYACYGDLVFAARAIFHQSKRAYQTCRSMPWPTVTPATFTNAAPPPVKPPPASTAAPAGNVSSAGQTRSRTHRLGTQPPPGPQP